MCRSLASSKEVEQAAQDILKNKDHPAFIGALKWATENGYGKPKESVELTGKDGGPIEVAQTWKFGNRTVAF